MCIRCWRLISLTTIPHTTAPCRIGFNLIAALLPTKGRFVPDEEELAERPAGPLQSAKVSLATPKEVGGHATLLACWVWLAFWQASLHHAPLSLSCPALPAHSHDRPLRPPCLPG